MWPKELASCDRDRTVVERRGGRRDKDPDAIRTNSDRSLSLGNLDNMATTQLPTREGALRRAPELTGFDPALWQKILQHVRTQQHRFLALRISQLDLARALLGQFVKTRVEAFARLRDKRPA